VGLSMPIVSETEVERERLEREKLEQERDYDIGLGRGM